MKTKNTWLIQKVKCHNFSRLFMNYDLVFWFWKKSKIKFYATGRKVRSGKYLGILILGVIEFQENPKDIFQQIRFPTRASFLVPFSSFAYKVMKFSHSEQHSWGRQGLDCFKQIKLIMKFVILFLLIPSNIFCTNNEFESTDEVVPMDNRRRQVNISLKIAY